MSAIGIIGGTGVYDPSIFENIHEDSLMTPFGEIDYVQGTYIGKTVIFVARHGKDHTIPPHKINYRANIWGLKKLGVKFIISTTAVGVHGGNPVLSPSLSFAVFIGLKLSTSYSGDITFFITSSTIPFGNGLKVNIPCTEESLFNFSKASIYCS